MKINPKEFVSALQPIKGLAKRNKAFDALSDEEKRKEIAYDCFNLTLEKKLLGGDELYWSSNLSRVQDRTVEARKFQELLNYELPDDCVVCARGGLMLSPIRLGNKIKPYNISLPYGREDILQGFSMIAFIEMEKEFEDLKFEHPYDVRTTEKLQNICLNIIANGDFNKEDKTDYLVEYLKK